LHSFDSGGGAEAVARLNHRGLRAAGHSSQLIVGKKTSNDPDIEQLQIHRGIPGLKRFAQFVESSTGLQYTYSPSFRNVSAQFSGEPDLVHIHGLHGAEGWADLGGVTRLASKIPLVCSVQDLWLLAGHCLYPLTCEKWKSGCGQCPDLNRYPAIPKDSTRLNWLRKRWLFNRLRIPLIVPTNWVREQVKQSPILSNSEAWVVPNPIDLEVFSPGDRAAAKARLGIAEGAQTVLVVANDLSNVFKGAGDAVQVLNGLKGVKPFVILVGKNSAAFSARIELPTKAVGYMESTSDLAECYRAADVFLMPSRAETFGMVAAEAVACGSAVVSYKAGGLEEVCRAIHGIAVDDNDISSMREALEQLLRSPAEIRRRAAEGQLHVKRAYSVEAHVSGCVDVYREAISQFQV
jgi:glycosyltransferase involved in cell wall biosynthesis